MDLLDFARGPALAFALLVFVSGTLWRLFGVLRRPRLPDLSPAREGAPPKRVAALRAIGRGMWPRKEFGQSVLLISLNGYVFHIGLALVFFGYAPHIAFVRRLIGLSWPALPDGVMYLAAGATIVSLLLALWLRVTDLVRGGPGAAVVSTMIYAIPPAIRITALGIRGVPSNTVEAATSMGSTRRQLLAKVQLPLSRRMLLLGINQTILFALSMVVIAGLIGGGGLGDVVTSGLYSNPALAILAGIAIVVMAMALDRSTEAVADRTDPTRRHLDEADRRRLRITTIALAVVAIGAVVLAKALGVASIYPEANSAQEWLLTRIQAWLDYVTDPANFVFKITEPVGTFILVHLFQPLQEFLMEAPWFTTVLGLTAIAFVVSGLRPAVTTLVMLVWIGVMGMWEPAMDTFSQVLVATAMTVLIGIVLGVWAAESKTVSRVLRPVNDVLQTLPQLVYIIPFVYLFPVSIVPGIIASVLYAFPVVVRLVERGVRDVAPETVEAASAFGATRRQVLTKVKIPLASDAIMLGVNQGIIMVLAVVVIGGLVGSGGLGYLVAQGLVRGEFGLGVIASLAILALGIALDRVTQATRRARKEAIQ